MGFFGYYDPATGREYVVESFTCPHHNTVHKKLREEGFFCRKCYRQMCSLCEAIESSGGTACKPFEAKLDVYEKKLDAEVSRRGLDSPFLAAIELEDDPKVKALARAVARNEARRRFLSKVVGG